MLKPVLSGLALLLISYSAVAQPQIELKLTQLIDPNCQGTELLADSSAEPGQCIRYQLKVHNLGTSAAQAVSLSLPVPQHTNIKQSLESNQVGLPAAQLQTTASGEKLLQTQIERLDANQELTLNYSVQVL